MTYGNHLDIEPVTALTRTEYDALQTDHEPASEVSWGSGAPKRKRLAALDTDWQAYSNCVGVDPDLFFPPRGASTAEPKAVCRECVVRTECLEYALAAGEHHGIWGGRSEQERRGMRARRRAGEVA